MYTRPPFAPRLDPPRVVDIQLSKHLHLDAIAVKLLKGERLWTGSFGLLLSALHWQSSQSARDSNHVNHSALETKRIIGPTHARKRRCRYTYCWQRFGSTCQVSVLVRGIGVRLVLIHTPAKRSLKLKVLAIPVAKDAR